MLVKLTEKFLLDHRTPKGGWTRAQLAVIGVAWPPPKTWRKEVVGQDITGEQADQFIAAAGIFAGSTLKRHAGDERRIARHQKRLGWKNAGVSIENKNETLAQALDQIMRADHINAAKKLAEMALKKVFGPDA